MIFRKTNEIQSNNPRNMPVQMEYRCLASQKILEGRFLSKYGVSHLRRLERPSLFFYGQTQRKRQVVKTADL